MAVYRSDQAQVTFGTESGAHGGYPEAATSVNAQGSEACLLTADTEAGSRSIAVDGLADSSEIEVGDFIQIGALLSGTNLYHNTEVRRVEHVGDITANAATITLNAPTSFFHANNTNITHVAALGLTDEDEDKFITWVPGVYETVDVPDPEMAIEGRYLLGTNQKRNFYVAYKGQQTFQGSIGGFVLLNGWPLRYSIGSVTSIPDTGLASDTGNDARYLKGIDTIAPKKGDLWIRTNTPGSEDIENGDIVGIGSKSAANLDVDDKCEIRRIVDTITDTDKYYRLNYPLQYDHPDENSGQVCTTAEDIASSSAAVIDVDTPAVGNAISDGLTVGDYVLIESEALQVTGVTDKSGDTKAFLNLARAKLGTSEAAHSEPLAVYKITPIQMISSANYYQHDIREQVDLDTVSWHVHMRDSSETAVNDFDRRYYGGHIGSTTITAEEGGLLTASWDSVTFQDMIHNQKDHSSVTPDVPGYSLMHSIEAKDVGAPLQTGSYSTNIDSMSAGGFPSTEPYYFSQGSLTMFGVEFARVRSFSLSINNGEEARYYIGGQGKGSRRHRGPTEIREMQREYSMSATIVLPDSHNADGMPSGTAAATRRLFTELLLEGDYGSDTATDMSGFNVVLTFLRGTNDSVTFTVPGSSGGSTAGAAAKGGAKQGAFIRSAPHTITGDNPFQVDVDILFRNMDIQIKDSEPFYP